MFLNLKCLLFSVIIIFAIIYTSSNSFIPLDQDFFPIVYAQLLPLPLPTLPYDKVVLEQQQNENKTDRNHLSFEENMTNEEVIIPTQVTYPYGPPVDVGHTYIDIFDPDNKCHPNGAHFVVCDISLGEDIHLINTCYLTCIAFRSDPFVNNIFNAGATITGVDGNNFHFIWTNAGPIGKYYYDVESHCLITKPKDPNDPNSHEECIDLGEVKVEINVRQPIINTPPNPIIDVSPSNTVESGTTVTLDGSRSNDPDPEDSITLYRWTQVDGPDLGLGILNTPTIQFIAPQVTQNTTFTYSFTVIDRFGNHATIQPDITVTPKPQNNPPVAVATCTTPDGVCTNIQPESKIHLTGFKSYDPDAPDDFVVGYQWKKTNPEDTIVEDTLTAPNSIETNFDVPYFVPYQPTSSSTSPTLLPIEFSLVVTDKHGANSPPDKISINMECSASDQRKGEYFRDLLRGAIILNNEFPLNPQTADNMKYFLSGTGDIIPKRNPAGNFVGVTENDNPKPLPIEWLENTSYFQKAQKDFAKQILKDVNDLLKQMKVGETRILNPDPYQVHIETSGNFPTDYVTAIGSAPAFAEVSLTITKGGLFKANTISGKIELKLADIYDFNPAQIFRIPLLGVATSEDVYNAIKCLGARNFDQTTIYNKIIIDMNVRDFLKDFPDCDDPNECKIQQ